MEEFVRGDIVVLEFPFSNLIQAKRRPSLIIKVPKGEDVIVCQITGKSYEKSVEIPIKRDDFNKGNLKVDSYMRLDKIFSVEKKVPEDYDAALKNIMTSHGINFTRAEIQSPLNRVKYEIRKWLE